MRIFERTVVFVITMAIIFLLFLLVGHFPGIISMNWRYLISGDPAWRWVVNIFVAAVVAALIYYFNQILWPKTVAIICFFLGIIIMESFAWHTKEALDIIKATEIFVDHKGSICMAIIALIAFIINGIIFDSQSEEDE